MDPLVMLAIGALSGLLVGAAIAWLLGRVREARTRGIEQLQAEAASTQLRIQLAQAQGEADTLRLQLEQTRQDQQSERQRLQAEGQKQQEQERLRLEQESKVLQALSPVQKTLGEMQRKVSELEQQRMQQYGTIAEQLQRAHSDGERLRSTTESLASALRNNSTRGAWGEAQLRNIVESAGLTHRVDFELQSTLVSDEGRSRPDMVVKLPGGKKIAVDAKVPFNAYLEANAIPAGADGAEGARRASLLKEHQKALKGHIDALATRDYASMLGTSPDFVIAFVPSESLLAAAMDADPTLLDHSFSKGIALASPVSFMAVLKAVAFTWQQDLITDDARKLFDLSRTLYQRMSVLGEHTEKLRRSIERTVESYNKFASSLEGRVLPTARQLNALDESRVLGEATQIVQAPQALTAAELHTDADAE